jgi:hypothetical protein
MSQNIFTAVLVKKNGKLEYNKKGIQQLFERFVNTVKDGEKVDVIFEVQFDTATAAQLAKIHANIRELANETGHTFEEIKLIVKEKSGLCINKKIEGEEITLCKSFGDCSREELNLAIQASIEIGENLGINLY